MPPLPIVPIGQIGTTTAITQAEEGSVTDRIADASIELGRIAGPVSIVEILTGTRLDNEEPFQPREPRQERTQESSVPSLLVVSVVVGVVALGLLEVL